MNSEEQGYLKRILKAARRMDELIDGLLEFSHLGRQSFVTRGIPGSEIARMVNAVIEELNASDPQRRVEWRLGEFKSCKGNRVLIRQVWANLLENAYKYTRGCPAAVIEVGTTVTEHGKTYFVRDNGAGFDMEYANKLFGVFQRLHREGEYEGAGIGLALVQRIVQRHGGRVWAESAVGKGAAFYFTLE